MNILYEIRLKNAHRSEKEGKLWKPTGRPLTKIPKQILQNAFEKLVDKINDEFSTPVHSAKIQSTEIIIIIADTYVFYSYDSFLTTVCKCWLLR